MKADSIYSLCFNINQFLHCFQRISADGNETWLFDLHKVSYAYNWPNYADLSHSRHCLMSSRNQTLRQHCLENFEYFRLIYLFLEDA